MKPIWPKNSNLSGLPDLNFKSNTAPVAFPYSEGNAPDKKSLVLKLFEFNIDTGPPVVPNVDQWLGEGISTPSNRHKTVEGEFPLTIISFRSSAEPATPA